MKDSYVYPALFKSTTEGVAVEFPDLPGCLSCAEDIDRALFMARDAMSLYLYEAERSNDPIPEPSNPSHIEVAEDQVVVLVDAWMPAYRSRLERKSVNTMVTLPRWLKELGEREKISFSAVLQDALKELLHVSEPPLLPRRR